MSNDLCDKFCWLCSKKTKSVFLKCSNCVRSYHKTCAEKKSGKVVDANTWVCQECRRQDDFPDSLLRFIPIMINFIMQEKEAKKLSDIEFPENIVHSINLKQISQKQYISFGDFRTDIEWFAHHLRTKKGGSDGVRWANWILKEVNEEKSSLMCCSECYENASKSPENSFTIPCKKPHVLVWTNCVGWGWWPSKILQYDSKNDMVNVRFFGDHTSSSVPSSDCYIFSKNPPVRVQIPQHADAYNLALKEVDEYIEEIKKTFGIFNYATTGTPFKPEKLEEHMMFMIGKTPTLTPFQIGTTNTNDLDNINDYIEHEEVATDQNDVVPTVEDSSVIEKVLNETSSNSQNSLKRPASNDLPTSDLPTDTNKVRTNLQEVWKSWLAQQNTIKKLKADNDAILAERHQLKLELECSNDYIKTIENDLKDSTENTKKLEAKNCAAATELTKVKGELAAEKAKNKNVCIVCSKQCLMFCGPNCLNVHIQQQQQQHQNQTTTGN